MPRLGYLLNLGEKKKKKPARLGPDKSVAQMKFAFIVFHLFSVVCLNSIHQIAITQLTVDDGLKPPT